MDHEGSIEGGDSLKRRELDIADAKRRDEKELKQRELELAAARLAQERDLKEKELKIQRYQLAAGRWTGPVAVAVAAGILGILGSLFSARQNREVERKKLEGTLVLEAIRTDPTAKQREAQAAANLVFLSDAGLIQLEKEQLDKLRKRAGDVAPSLPPATAPSQVAPDRLPEAVRDRIRQSFDAFGAYFVKLGLAKAPKVGIEIMPPGIDSIAYYDPDKRTAFVEAKSLAIPNVALREYAHAVLYSDERILKAVSFDQTWVYTGIESGLASYFASSFTGDPSLPGAPGRDSLKNGLDFSQLKPGAFGHWQGTLTWGATFWDLRERLGKDVADKVLYSAWSSLGEKDIAANEPGRFARQIIAADKRLNGGANDEAIRAVFKQRRFAVLAEF